MKEIKLNKKYSLDLRSLAPVEVKTLEFTDKGVKCSYLNSYSNRVEELSYELFEMNGYNKPEKIEKSYKENFIDWLKIEYPNDWENILSMLEKESKDVEFFGFAFRFGTIIAKTFTVPNLVPVEGCPNIELVYPEYTLKNTTDGTHA